MDSVQVVSFSHHLHPVHPIHQIHQVHPIHPIHQILTTRGSFLGECRIGASVKWTHAKTLTGKINQVGESKNKLSLIILEKKIKELFVPNEYYYYI